MLINSTHTNLRNNILISILSSIDAKLYNKLQIG